MSSHHIVREKQEPALLIITYQQFEDEHLGQLLEWSPTIFVLEAEEELIHQKGIKIDVVLRTTQEEGRHHTEDYTRNVLLKDIRLGTILQLLIDEGYPSVNIIGELKMLPELLPFVNQLDIVLFDNKRRAIPVKSRLEKWYRAGELLEVVNVQPTQQYEVSGDVEEGLAGKYRLRSSGLFLCTTSTPPIFIIEEIDHS